MNHDAIKGLPKSLVEDVAMFLRGEKVAEPDQLDEISKKTLGSYIKKAVDQVPAYKAGADSLEKAASDYRSKELSDTAQKLRVKQFNRSAGIKKAADKLSEDEIDFEDLLVVNEDLEVGVFLSLSEDVAEIMFDDEIVSVNTSDIMLEEVEQLDELSKDTMKSYMAKAKADPAFEKKKGKPSKATVAIRSKREKGISNAKEKLQAIVKAENEARNKKLEGLTDKVNLHFANQAPHILEKHGFKKVAAGNGVETYIHPHDNGHVSMISLHAPRENDWDKRHQARAVNSKGSSWSAHQAHNGIWSEEHHDKHMNEMLPKFEKHVIDVKDSTAREGNW